eukprot:COSAG02_NODE_32168_length_521_cov_0.646919_1_plen_24_part_10
MPSNLATWALTFQSGLAFMNWITI